MIHFSKNIKPKRIWIVQAYNDDSGLFSQRAFNYKSEGEQYRKYCINEEKMNAEIFECMLY